MITDYVNQKNHEPDWEHTKIVARESNTKARKIKEAITIMRTDLNMNWDMGNFTNSAHPLRQRLRCDLVTFGLRGHCYNIRRGENPRGKTFRKSFNGKRLPKVDFIYDQMTKRGNREDAGKNKKEQHHRREEKEAIQG